MTEFLRFLTAETGASSAEYALILAIVGGGIVFAALALGDAIGASVNTYTDCIETQNC